MSENNEKDIIDLSSYSPLLHQKWTSSTYEASSEDFKITSSPIGDFSPPNTPVPSLLVPPSDLVCVMMSQELKQQTFMFAPGAKILSIKSVNGYFYLLVINNTAAAQSEKRIFWLFHTKDRLPSNIKSHFRYINSLMDGADRFCHFFEDISESRKKWDKLQGNKEEGKEETKEKKSENSEPKVASTPAAPPPTTITPTTITF